jgi:hypothetical protein
MFPSVYQSAVSVSVDSEYISDCRTIQRNVTAIQSKASDALSLARHVNIVEGRSEVAKATMSVQRVQKIIDIAVQQASETKQQLDRFLTQHVVPYRGNEYTNRHDMYLKLSDGLARAARELEVVVTKFRDLERRLDNVSESVQMKTVGASRSAEGDLIDLSDDGEVPYKNITPTFNSNDSLKSDKLLDLQVSLKDVYSSFYHMFNLCFTIFQYDLEEGISRVRVASAQRVERDMVALQEIYTALNKEVRTQQVALDEVERQMINAKDATEDVRFTIEFVGHLFQTNAQLSATLVSRRRSRRRKVFIVSSVVTALLVYSGVLYISH